MGKGHARERELARRIADENWMVMRSPASGSVDRPNPDLLATHRDRRAVAAEVKYSSSDKIYLSPDEGRDLCAFASGFGAVALAVFRWSGDTRYYPRRVTALPTTDGGSFVGDHETAQQEGWHDGGLPNAVLGIESADAEVDAATDGEHR